jgi:hypothetical protein
VPEQIEDPYGENFYDESELCNFLFNILDEANRQQYGKGNSEWSHFEDSLGSLDFTGFLHSYSDIMKNYKNEWYGEHENEDTTCDARNAFIELRREMYEWIKSASLHKKCSPQKEFQKLLTPRTTVLNFNYSYTIEKIYNFKNVIHIHGNIYNKDSIIIGHQKKSTIEETDLIFPGAFGISEINEFFTKNTDEIIKKNEKYFHSLSKINSVYVYGFSFAAVDIPYISKIISETSNQTRWFLDANSIERENILKYAEILHKNNCKNISVWNNLI